ncbi:MAG: hypothetical protein EOO91_15310 [Pedobacter sp.]|nr:MAG: hypothetical protein EOO91_15310 [Pedobacter sp.]
MKLFLFKISTFLLFLPFISSAQINYRNEMQKRIFSTDYHIQQIKRFKGKIIIIDSSTIKYDDKILSFRSPDSNIKLLFTIGIFYPEVINQAIQVAVIKDGKTVNKINLASTKKVRKPKKSNSTVLDNLLGTNNLSFSNFEELYYLEDSFNKKRFTFWLSRKRIMNPTVYYFELTNDIATKETSIEDFIKGAKLTVLREGEVVI